MSTTEILAVKGMSCDHCKGTVTKAVKGLDGVNSVDVDVATGRVKVEFDADQVGLEEIKKVITGAGYGVA